MCRFHNIAGNTGLTGFVAVFHMILENFEQALL